MQHMCGGATSQPGCCCSSLHHSQFIARSCISSAGCGTPPPAICPHACIHPKLCNFVQVLANVSEIIAELHDARYVHRDLKPSNIMWQPRTLTWVLIDFGLTCRAGKRSPVGFTATYAPPEVLSAQMKGRKAMEASPAFDAWALGVIAFELLTGRPPFTSSRQVRTSH